MRVAALSRARKERRTLLESIPYLRLDGEADRNAYWVITSIVAFTLLGSIVIDLVVHRHAIAYDAQLFWLTSLPLIPATLFVVMPWFLRRSFPRWIGGVGYFIAILIACANIAFSGDEVLATTALHILPICALYLGWFWRLGVALGQFAGSMVLVLVSVTLSDVIGMREAVTPSTVVFGILLTGFAFTIGLYLRYQLKKKALTDQLTGVWNARGIRRALTVEINRAVKRGEPLTIAYCDFDNFKSLNDTHGHAYGDSVLSTTVQSWVRGLRPYDVVGRLGGDEFVIVFPRTTPEQAVHILLRIQAASGHPWTWGISDAQVLDSSDSLLDRADRALYQNKQLRSASPTWMNEPETPDESRLPEPRVGLIRRLYQHQSEFSTVSALLALVVSGGIIASILGGDYQRDQANAAIEGWIALMIAAAGVVVPLWLGRRYPPGAGLFAAMILLSYYAYQSATSASIQGGIPVMFSLSLVALYLGTFSGTLLSRLTLSAGVVAVIAPILTRAYREPPYDDEQVMLVTALYSVLMCVVLFELGSYLYNRSRTYAHLDALTGALNRHGLAAYGRSEISRARRTGQHLAAVALDCVDFKRVNDTQGHAAGDELLRELVIYFIDALELFDHVVRTGGDEFVLLLPYRTEQAAEALLEDMLPHAPRPLRYGVAGLRPDDTIATLIARADARIRRSGAQATNTTVIASGTMTDQGRETQSAVWS